MNRLATIRNGFRLQQFILDADTGDLFNENGQFCKRLRPQVLKVLLELLGHSGDIVEKKRVMDLLWKGTNTNIKEPERAIRKIIRGLRRNLGDSVDAPRYIQVIPRRGFRFIAPVEKLEMQTATSRDQRGTEAATALRIQSENLFLPEESIPKIDMKSAEMTNVRIYQLAAIGGRPAKDLIAVNSDEGMCIIDSNTGDFLDFEPANLTVDQKLFEKAGRLALITGLGGPSVVPGVTTIESGDRVFRVLFTLPGLCVASIEG
jgi:DNA-binding winged helix-turn-helix (wHTH) protein